MTRAYVSRIDPAGLNETDVVRAFEWLGWEDLVPAGSHVFLKPNLTWPEHIPGVTTTPQAIEAVVAALRKHTSYITVGEADGGYHSFQAEEAFRSHQLYELAEKYGASIVNLSKGASETFAATVAGRSVKVTLPCVLLHETDVFITLPVPKVHVMTGVSLAFKNQWGCIPSSMRLREHPQFDHKIVAINRRLNPRVIFDGTYFLDGAGPMTGEALRMDLLLAADEVGTADAVCCRLMGIEPASIHHLCVAQQEEMLPDTLANVELNAMLDPFLGRRFVSRRAFVDWISLLTFRSRGFAWLLLESPAASSLRQLLYAVRRNPLACRLLYGPAGSPPDLKPKVERGTG